MIDINKSDREFEVMDKMPFLFFIKKDLVNFIYEEYWISHPFMGVSELMSNGYRDELLGVKKKGLYYFFWFKDTPYSDTDIRGVPMLTNEAEVILFLKEEDNGKENT